MARSLVRTGHDVTVVCGSYGAGVTGLEHAFRHGKREGTVDGIRVIEFDISYANTDGFLRRTALFLLFAIRGLIHALRDDYDVLFATTTPLTAALPGIAARWIRRKPFVFEVRDLWPELPRAMGVITNPMVLWSLSILEWCAYRSADRLIGLSPGIVTGIADRGVRDEIITMVPNGCDLSFFADAQSADVCRAELPSEAADLAGTDLLAVYSGTHGRANGLDVLVDAAKQLELLGRTDIKILLVGAGSEKQRLKARAEGMACIRFSAPVAKAELIPLFGRADVGLQILASVPAFYYGTSPNKFFDYLAAGLPVLTNYPGWVADLIKQHDCGLACSPEPTSIARALIQAADDRATLRRQGTSARLLAETEFDRRVLAQRWGRWVEGTLKAPGSPAL